MELTGAVLPDVIITVLIFGHPKVFDHFFSCNGNQPVPPDRFIKICGLKLITKDTIPLAVLCEDCHV